MYDSTNIIIIVVIIYFFIFQINYIKCKNIHRFGEYKYIDKWINNLIIKAFIII